MKEKQCEKDYTLKLDERKELPNGSVKYEIRVICDETGEKIVDTSYTVSKRQEDPNGKSKDFKEMIKEFAHKKALEHEQGLGHDYSGKEFSI